MSSKHIKLKIWFQSHCRAQQVCPGVRLCVFQCTNNMCMRGQVLAALWAAMFSDWQVKIANFILWFHLGCSGQLWNHDCCFGWEGSDAVIGSTIKANKKEVNWALQVFDSVYLQSIPLARVFSDTGSFWETHGVTWYVSPDAGAMERWVQRSASKGLTCEFLLISWWGVGFLFILIYLGSCSTLWAQQVSSLSPCIPVMAFGRHDSIVANLAQTRCPKAGTLWCNIDYKWMQHVEHIWGCLKMRCPFFPLK